MRKSQQRATVAGGVDIAYADARHLALEMAGEPGPRIDTMAAGVVLQDGEIPRRVLNVWVSMWLAGEWAPGSTAEVLLSDKRLLWWDALVGFTADLAAGYVVLDFGDGRPRSLSGRGAAAVAVAGVARLYGTAALLTHPVLEPLRQARFEQSVRST